MRISILSILVLIAFIPHLASAQEGGESTRTCRILYLSPNSSSPSKKLQLFDGKSCREVALPRMNLSKIHKLEPGRLTLRMLSEPIVDPFIVPEGAPSVVIPENLQHIYLLVVSDLKNKVAPVKMRVVNANHDQIGRGEMLWFNLTKSTVGGQIGSQKLNIKPGAQTLLKEPARGRKGYPVQIYFQVPGDKFIHPLKETRWRHDPSSRTIAFIMVNGKRRAPQILTFSDYRIPEKKEPDAP